MQVGKFSCVIRLAILPEEPFAMLSGKTPKRNKQSDTLNLLPPISRRIPPMFCDRFGAKSLILQSTLPGGTHFAKRQKLLPIWVVQVYKCIYIYRHAHLQAFWGFPCCASGPLVFGVMFMAPDLRNTATWDNGSRARSSGQSARESLAVPGNSCEVRGD